jgi:hypothetical protein
VLNFAGDDFCYHIFKQKIILKNKTVKPSGVHDPG